jgi:hypothetical protein
VRPPEPDEVSFGRSGPPRFRLPGWLRDRRIVAGLALVVAIPVLIAAIGHHGHGRHRHHHVLAPPPRAGTVTVLDVGPRLLGVRGRWSLFAEGPGVLLRIQLAAGVITRTRVPPLQSSGAVSLLAGPRQAIIRPADFVPGYLVPDGRPARFLPAALGQAGRVFPGPRRGLLWVQTRFGAHEVMSLVNFAGRHSGGSVTFRGPLVFLAVPDGRGYFLVQHGSVVYDVRPDHRRLVAVGTLDAAGPSAWLITRCSHGRCAYEVVDPANGARYRVPGQAAAPGASAPTGVTSPDGRVAAVVRRGHGHRWLVHLIDLVTGADRVLAGRVMEPFGPNPATLAWSPDGRWLFAVTADGVLVAFDPRTGQPFLLGVALPPVTQLAVRAGGWPGAVLKRPPTGGLCCPQMPHRQRPPRLRAG